MSPTSAPPAGAIIAVAEARLRWTQFPEPGALITAEDVRHGKPDPEPWLRAAEALGVTGRR